MTQQSNQEDQLSGDNRSRRRRSSKIFPSAKFEDVLIIAKTILEDGIDGRLRRRTLFERLNQRPSSNSNRKMITSSSRYGLTSGGHSAEYLTLTEDGKDIVSQTSPHTSVSEKAFRCAINKIAIFDQIYEKLKGNRLPAQDVLQDQFSQLGLNPEECAVASEVFLANSRYVGIIREVNGNEHIISIEQFLERTQAEETSMIDIVSENSSDDLMDEQQSIPVPTLPPSRSVPAEPSLHIDIQIHIDSTATSDQINQIFSSMARHLYGRKE